MSSTSYEFQVESLLSSKELNNQSVSLVIPRITRDKIHNMLYYKVNLTTNSLRGDTILELSKIMIRDLGTLKGNSINVVHMLGGVEFKCLLMKLIEIRPNIDQLFEMFQLNEYQKNDTKCEPFDDKYIIALLLVYVRLQYAYLRIDDPRAIKFHKLFREYIKDFRKLKSIDFEADCWSQSQNIPVSIKHMDELVDYLVLEKQIWGIPLGTCRWCNIFNEESDTDSSSDSNSSFESDSD